MGDGAEISRSSPARANGGDDTLRPGLSLLRPTRRKRRTTGKRSILSLALFVILAWFGLVLGSYRTVVSHHDELLDSSLPRKERRGISPSTRRNIRRGSNRVLVTNATNRRPAKETPSVRQTKAQPRKDDAAQNDRFGKNEPNENVAQQHPTNHQGTKGGADLGPLPRCGADGGPDDESFLREMVYWRTIPGDYSYLSPYLRGANLTSPSDNKPRKYLHFELDDCGFNNNRIVFETALVLAHAMGRTLVIPPRRKMYGMDDDDSKIKPTGYYEYFPLEELGESRDGIDFISTMDFLKEEAMTGNLRDLKSGRPVYPPGRRTNWDGAKYHPFRAFIRSVSVQPEGWDPEECLIAFPERPGEEGVRRFKGMMNRAMGRDPRPVLPSQFRGNPTPTNASAEDRFREAISERKKTCLITKELRDARVINFPVTATYRFMMHFYAAVFFEDWRADLWYKRLIRDTVRFGDDIVCAAAKIVEALRTRARERGKKARGGGDGNAKVGEFDSFHVRRTDFQILYEGQANETGQMIFNTSKEWIPPNKRRVVYVATDERNKTFFGPLEGAYDVRYLDHYAHLLKGVSSNLYPMIEMMVAARGATFVGMYWSTFTGYVNRLRGYYSQSEKMEGYARGELRHSHHYNSVEYVPKNEYLVYKAVKRPAWYREFPVAWRDIDRSVGKMKK